MKQFSTFFRIFLKVGMPLCVFSSAAFAASATSEEALASAKDSMTLATLAAESACDGQSSLEDVKMYAENAGTHAAEARAYADEAASLYATELLMESTPTETPSAIDPSLEISELDLFDTTKKAPETSEWMPKFVDTSFEIVWESKQKVDQDSLLELYGGILTGEDLSFLESDTGYQGYLASVYDSSFLEFGSDSTVALIQAYADGFLSYSYYQTQYATSVSPSISIPSFKP